MTTVFISYRREETAGEARALFKDLVARLGEKAVFMDVDNIAPGQDFRRVLQERLASCDHLLALVGRDWVAMKNTSGQRRLDDPGDFVRFEIEAALKRDIAVTPVLVQGAEMPKATQLPEGITDFAYRNGFELSHNRWESDLQEMLRRLDIGTARAVAPASGSSGLLKELAVYLPNLMHLVARPKRSITSWTGTPKNDLTGPLIFVAISVAIGFLLQLPQIDKEHSFLTLVASMAVFKVIALVLLAAIIHLAFLAVRGRASFSTTLSAYLYLVSPLYLAVVVLETVSLGVLRAHDPSLATAARALPQGLLTDQEQMRAFQAAAPGLASAYLFLTSAPNLLVLGWFTVCWGAFRQLHSVSRWRSTLAGIATFLFGAALFSGLNYLLLGMFGSFTPPLR